jgi:hypothetical protein
MSKNGTKFSLHCPFKVNRRNVKKFHFFHILFIIVLVNKISELIFRKLNPDAHPHLESAFEMRIADADPGDQNHADADPQHCFKSYGVRARQKR